MKKHIYFTALLLGALIFFNSCEKDYKQNNSITVSFSSNTIDITKVDSVVVDLIGTTATDYRHLALEKKDKHYTIINRAPEKTYDANIIIYLRAENNNSYAFLLRQPYSGNGSITEIAPSALLDETKWKTMGRVFDRNNNFFALIGIAPNNPLLYLFTNTQKRDYIYIDKEYTHNGQTVGGGTYEYSSNIALSYPVIIANAFQETTNNMNGKAWSAINSMTITMNQQTGDENLFTFTYTK